MPFKSKAQQKFLFANEPEVAEEFAAHTPKGAYNKLPEHVKSKAKKVVKKPVKKTVKRAAKKK